jgi:hypothetical protein
VRGREEGEAHPGDGFTTRFGFLVHGIELMEEESELRDGLDQPLGDDDTEHREGG